MRRLPMLLATLLLAALLAGCASDDDGAAGPTPSTQATPSPTPPTPTPTTPEVTPSPPTPPTPETREAKTVYNGTHDFSGAPSAPNAPPRIENFTVDEGYATLVVRIAWTATSGPAGDISLSAGATVRVVDPQGTVVVDCSGKDDPDCSKDLAAPAAGAWKVEYAGSATAQVSVTITEIP